MSVGLKLGDVVSIPGTLKNFPTKSRLDRTIFATKFSCGVFKNWGPLFT